MVSTTNTADRTSGADTWIRHSLNQIGCHPTSEPEVIEDWLLGDVWCVPTNLGNVYFKATARLPFFSNEAGVCRFLGGVYGKHIPAVIAADTDRGWLLTHDFGESLENDADSTVAVDVHRLWGKLQIESIDHVQALIHHGCKRRPIHQLAQQFDWHVNQAAIQSVLAHNGVEYPVDLVNAIEESIQELLAYQLPECLVHGDLHRGNVARVDDTYVFFDWSDACISHPLIDSNFVRPKPHTPEKRELISAYLSNWFTVLPEPDLWRAWNAAETACYAHQFVSDASFILQQTDSDEFTSDLLGDLYCLTKSLQKKPDT